MLETRGLAFRLWACILVATGITLFHSFLVAYQLPYADASPQAISISTDKPTYYMSDRIIVSGSVGQVRESETLWIELKGNTILETKAAKVDPDGSYERAFRPDDHIFSEDEITITAIYGGQNASTVISYGYQALPSNYTSISVKSVDEQNPVIYGRTNGAELFQEYAIGYLVLSNESIEFQFKGGNRAEDGGSVELVLPKSLIDNVFSGMRLSASDWTTSDVRVREIANNSTHTTVRIMTPYTDLHSIVIHGNVVVPEFGPMIPIVSAVAIGGAIYLARIKRGTR